ncbi:MAG TPA: hypothetical protein PLU71_01555 [Candidatus Dependentiae bacterium]|nr:hypothetical protein [Candidatus Dependentiae bacterium]HRQ62518.1 hypothetical protein [Candidatus Dependentiae bacterium]
MNIKLSILVISLLCMNMPLLVAMEKSQKESLDSFMESMREENDFIQKELLKFYPVSASWVKELNVLDFIDISRNAPGLNLQGYSLIGITLLKNISFNEKQQVIRQLLQNGVKPMQKDIDIAFFYEYQHDPLKFERRWEVIKGYYSPNSSFVRLPKELILEIMKHVENQDLLIPKENMPSK